MTRLASIVNALSAAGKPLSVSDVGKLAGISMPAASHALHSLRNLGIADTGHHKRGLKSFWRLTGKALPETETPDHHKKYDGRALQDAMR